MLGKISWFAEGEVEKIHTRALELIEDIGFKLGSNDLIKSLKSSGAIVNPGTSNVRIPQNVAKHFLTKIPDKVTFYAADPRHDIELGEKRYYRPISGTIGIIENNRVRRPTVNDMGSISKIVQKLDCMNFNATSVIPFDVPDNVQVIASSRACFENCSKHVLVDALNRRDLEIILEMAFAVAGGESEFKKRPFLQLHFPAISPLIWDENACDAVRVATQYNIPMRVGSSPMSGANSPIKLAGTLQLMHAEVIAGAVVTQMLHEGCPIYYGAAPTIFDMRYGTMSWGAAEHAKMAACAAELARYCNMFVTSTGFATDSKSPDQQTAIEKSMNLLLAALSGMDVLAGAGLFEGELSYDIAQLVIDNEIARYVENIMRGISITQENVSIDLIKEVGIGGNYLETEQTLQYFKTEHATSELLDRRSREVWNGIEEKGIYEKAKKCAGDILSDDEHYTLPDRVMEEVDRIYRRSL
jgi:trimethylamine--corrinoid protein Co-methyltransferase